MNHMLPIPLVVLLALLAAEVLPSRSSQVTDNKEVIASREVLPAEPVCREPAPVSSPARNSSPKPPNDCSCCRASKPKRVSESIFSANNWSDPEPICS